MDENKLNLVRKKIDKLDFKLLDLIKHRTKLVKKVIINVDKLTVPISNNLCEPKLGKYGLYSLKVIYPEGLVRWPSEVIDN